MIATIDRPEVINAILSGLALSAELGDRAPWLSDKEVIHTAFTRSGVSGTWRSRTPVASKIAFAIAAGTVRVDGRPAPEAGRSGRLSRTMSSFSGASGIRCPSDW